MPPPATEPSRTLVVARAVCDASGVLASDPGAILVENARGGEPARVIDVGPPEVLYRRPEARSANQLDRSGCVLIPGLINAHTHLDLTLVGPRPRAPGSDFAEWADAIRTSRPTEPADIRRAVREGIRLSRKAGTIAVGDIAGAPAGVPSLEPLRAMLEEGFAGVSFVEFFAIGEHAAPSTDRALSLAEAGLGEQTDRTRIGLQPHAPYTVQPDQFRRAVRRAHALGVPICTHLAEHTGEREFIAEGTGPQRAFFERMGLWSASILDHYAKGAHPIDHAADALQESSVLAVHVNDCPDEGIDTLLDAGARVVYCPHASAYFESEAHFGPHRYREMIEAGLTVALGTDSIVNQPEAHLSVLEEARLLFRRDATDPRVLLSMATSDACEALGLSPDLVRLDAGGTPPVLLSVPVEPGGDGPVAGVMNSASEPETITL